MEILYWLIANVSKGGNLLLNVGPDGTGTIPEQAVVNLKTAGEWLKINGAAIYGSRPWRIDNEGPTNLHMGGTEHRKKAKLSFDFKSDDFWFTQKENKVYVMALARPVNNTILVKSLKGEAIKAIQVLGQSDLVNWEQTDAGLQVTLPTLKNDGIGYALEVQL